MINPAKILLDNLHDLYQLEPDYKSWKAEKFVTGSYRNYLLQQIHASLAALKMGADLQVIFHGDFMLNYEIDTVGLFSRTALLQKAMPERRALLFEIRKQDWPSFFSRILKYSLKIHEVLCFNMGVAVASGLYGCAVNYTEAINEEILGVSNETYDLLIYLLNPNQIKFTLAEMNRYFNYPQLNIQKLYWDEF